jgi:hypothetical protein
MNLVHPDRLTPCAGCPWIIGNQSRSQPCPGRHEATARAFTGAQGWHTVMECHTLPDSAAAQQGVAHAHRPGRPAPDRRSP